MRVQEKMETKKETPEEAFWRLHKEHIDEKNRYDETILKVCELYHQERMKQSSYPEHGLSKREHFAGMALQGFCSNPELAHAIKADVRETGVDATVTLAKMALETADELIKQLNE